MKRNGEKCQRKSHHQVTQDLAWQVKDYNRCMNETDTDIYTEDDVECYTDFDDIDIQVASGWTEEEREEYDNISRAVYVMTAPWGGMSIQKMLFAHTNYLMWLQLFPDHPKGIDIAECCALIEYIINAKGIQYIYQHITKTSCWKFMRMMVYAYMFCGKMGYANYIIGKYQLQDLTSLLYVEDTKIDREEYYEDFMNMYSFIYENC